MNKLDNVAVIRGKMRELESDAVIRKKL